MPKKAGQKSTEELRPEYDFSTLRLVARGPGRKTPEPVSILLAPDVAVVFRDSDSVNEALRLLIKAAKGAAPNR